MPMTCKCTPNHSTDVFNLREWWFCHDAVVRKIRISLEQQSSALKVTAGEHKVLVERFSVMILN